MDPLRFNGGGASRRSTFRTDVTEKVENAGNNSTFSVTGI